MSLQTNIISANILSATTISGGTLIINDNVGIGTIAPNQQLEITKNFRLPSTTYNSGAPYGIIYKGTAPFIHNFNYGNNGTVTTTGNNTFVGINAGNLTMGSTATLLYQSSNNVGIGTNALTNNTTGYQNVANGYAALYSNTTGNYNVANGYAALYSNTTGNYNVANGYRALYSNTTGYQNVANGYAALYSNTTGYHNVANGTNALYYNTTGNYNVANGYRALYYNTTGHSNAANGYAALCNNTTGHSNAANGYQALYNNTTGANNIAIGTNAGRYITDGVTANTIGNNSIFIGYDTRAKANGETNQIVIGYNATGLGSNTAVLGNSLITTTRLQGNVGIGTDAPAAKLDVNGNVIISGDTNTYGDVVFNDTFWDDMRIVPSGFDFAGTGDPGLVNLTIGTFVYKAYEFETSDSAYFSIQLPHTYKQNTQIYCHIHWTPRNYGVAQSGNTVAWKLEYTWANINSEFSGSTIIDMTDYCDGIDNKHQMTADIVLPQTDKNISSMMLCKIYRDTGDTWSETVTGRLPILLEVDFHYEIDRPGSRLKSSK